MINVTTMHFPFTIIQIITLNNEMMLRVFKFEILNNLIGQDQLGQ